MATETNHAESSSTTARAQMSIGKSIFMDYGQRSDCQNDAQREGFDLACDRHEDDGVWGDDDSWDDAGPVDQRHYDTGCGVEGEPMYMPDR